MKKVLLFLLLSSASLLAQVKGTVKDEKGNPIPFANIYIKSRFKLYKG